MNEIRLLASVSHPNIVSYKESFVDIVSQTVCLVMEHCEEGDMLSKIEQHRRNLTQFTEIELWSYLIQALSGLKALHDMNIMHRDIKSANILLNKAC